MRNKFASKRLLVFGFVLVVLVSLALPSQLTSARAEDSGACVACGLQCNNEAFSIMQECLGSHPGQYDYCGSKYDEYLNNCNRVVCNYGLGCNLSTNFGSRQCRVGPCI